MRDQKKCAAMSLLHHLLDLQYEMEWQAAIARYREAEREADKRRELDRKQCGPEVVR